MQEVRLRQSSVFAGFTNLRCLVSLTGQRTIFPFYHVVSDRPLPHIRHIYDYRGRTDFEQDLDRMLKHFTPIGIGEYLEGGPKRGKPGRMVLSFDDGLVECHQFIAPLLRRKGIPALFFLNNDFIDNRGLFFRYRAGILIEHLLSDPGLLQQAAESLAIPGDQVVRAILMIKYNQQPLLDKIAAEVGVDPGIYQAEHPVYMSAEQVSELAGWGFHLGAHSADHPEFQGMGEEEVFSQVSKSMEDIRKRFDARPACFAFPFSSDGVPEAVVERLLDEGIVDAIFGTSGLKRTGRKEFVQRIPMEAGGLPAIRLLKTEYLYYLMKAPLGKNRYFKSI
jgi:peptidoglycan/xylan/chitin deacetylase (PgdA/CDA1 family)